MAVGQSLFAVSLWGKRWSCKKSVDLVNKIENIFILFSIVNEF